jgi:hypothetical protein
MRQRRRGATANNSNSSKVHHREKERKNSNIYSAPLHISRVVLFLLNVCPDRAAGGPRLGFVPKAHAA